VHARADSAFAAEDSPPRIEVRPEWYF